jgi:lipid-binding SYLF domain-containing protein
MTQRASVMSTVLAGAVIVATSLAANTAVAAGDPELDARAVVTLDQFRNHDKDAAAVLKNSHAVMSFSSILKGAFLFGAEGGNGALQMDQKSTAYYNFAAASFGFQIGGQTKSLVVLFRDKPALDSFTTKEHWELGVDGQVAFFKHGEGITLSSIATTNPIVFYVFDNKGLLADFSLKGGKFTKLKR